MKAAIQARLLLVKLATFQINKEEFLDGLGHIQAGEMISVHWNNFHANPTAIVTSCLEIYQLINSLREEFEYQLQFYGMDSFRDDVNQLDIMIRILKRYSGE